MLNLGKLNRAVFANSVDLLFLIEGKGIIAFDLIMPKQNEFFYECADTSDLID